MEADEEKDITDLTRGVYRRQYAGFVGGRRINRLSLQAEAWFWRVHAAADDFGNLAAEPALVYVATAGRRAGEVTCDQVAGWFGEMIETGLVQTYEVAGECYAHIVDFEKLQPAGRSGRRVRRVPSSPWDGGAVAPTGAVAPAIRHGADEAGTSSAGRKKTDRTPARPAATVKQGLQVAQPDTPKDPPPARPAESCGVRGNPEESGRSDSDSDSDSESSSPARPPAAGEEIVLTFPCTDSGTGWPLRRSDLDRLGELFPGLDVGEEVRAALAHLESNPSKQRPMAQTGAFVTSWLQRSLNTPALRAKGAPARTPAGSTKRSDARMSAIDEELKR